MNRPHFWLARVALLGWLGYDFAALARVALTGEASPAELMLLAALAAAIAGVIRRPQPLAVRADGSAFLACLIALGVMVGAIALADIPYQPTLASFILELAAAALLLWSMIWLGRCFAVLPAAIGCVTAGPYAFVRHPVYAAYILWTLALALAYPHPLVAVAAAAEIAALCWRAILEERLLRATLADYRHYSRRVRYRFLPGVM